MHVDVFGPMTELSRMRAELPRVAGDLVLARPRERDAEHELRGRVEFFEREAGTYAADLDRVDQGFARMADTLDHLDVEGLTPSERGTLMRGLNQLFAIMQSVAEDVDVAVDTTGPVAASLDSVGHQALAGRLRMAAANLASQARQCADTLEDVIDVLEGRIEQLEDDADDAPISWGSMKRGLDV